ncbi:uncharacterized protein LOC124912719 [Impatiens glandulifera]|uniref:uncharacterized protein LOC124912719 n=1 Tax=Impatiens glandulifera TaxID=253017 RepID=UPI001FB173ED|nr:uncharacterized protein LOC124912719 [Impatiens glandulifera]
MQKKGNRSWKLLRLALIWLRKGAESRRTLVMDLRKFIKLVGCKSDSPAVLRRYGERQMSFDATPIIHVKMHRPRHEVTIFNIPCIKPPKVHFDYIDHDQYEDDDDQERFGCSYYVDEDDEIDLKAEQFITRFYQEMKIQK